MLKLQAPGSRWYTAVILVLFACLLVYGFLNGDPAVFVILGVLLVFFALPLLLLYVLNWRERRSRGQGRGPGGGIFANLRDDPSLLDDRDSPDHYN